jgi:hypothetical protein
MNPWGEIPDCPHRIELFADDWHSYEIKRSLAEKSLTDIFSTSEKGRLASFLWSDSTITEPIICLLLQHSESIVTRLCSIPLWGKLPPSHEENIGSQCFSRMRMEDFLSKVQTMGKWSQILY